MEEIVLVALNIPLVYYICTDIAAAVALMISIALAEHRSLS
jgi:hypothetical protein